MGTKADPSRFDAYGKADDNEPIFTLIGRDPAAPEMIRAWVRKHQELGTDGIKLMEALNVADAMERYRMNRPKEIVVELDDN